MPAIRGLLEPYFETGTEGIIWSVEEDNKPGYEGLHPIDEGDELIIYDSEGIFIFHDTIIQDREAGYQKYPKNPDYGQPTALGYWIHWTQKGYHPDAWAWMFFARLPAILKKGT